MWVFLTVQISPAAERRDGLPLKWVARFRVRNIFRACPDKIAMLSRTAIAEPPLGDTIVRSKPKPALSQQTRHVSTSTGNTGTPENPGSFGTLTAHGPN